MRIRYHNISSSAHTNMSMKFLALFSLVTLVVAEPPVGHEGFQQGQFENAGQPSSQYGVPQGHRQQQRPTSQYGVPSGYAGDDNNEPANYEFKYDVEDQQYGVKFGHQENRQGDVAVGSYYVLLPDGRTQHVEYQADQDGYKPKITYEEGQGGYPRGGPGGSGGYQKK